MLGKVIERVTGKPYAQVLDERILRPLGLRDTGMMRSDTVLPRLASTYFHPEGTGRSIPDLPVYWENWYAAGSMYSTTADLRLLDQDATIVLLANTNRADLDELAQRIADLLVR